LLTVLLLRGPQTPGELRTRTERLHPFSDREQAEETLRQLAALDPPLVRELERQAGQQDRRWTHLLAVAPPEAAEPEPPVDREQVLADGPGARDRKVAGEYDRLAERYAEALADELDGKPFDRWLLDRLADDALRLDAAAQGLDVGCGPGQVAGYLADRGVAMTGLDASREMVEQARAAQPDLQVVHGSFVVPPMPRGGDPRNPGWALVTAWYAFVHLAGSEIAPTVRALTRVLRPGGVLALALHLGRELEHPGTLWGVDTDLDFVLHDPETVVAAAQAAGLEDLEWYRRSPLLQEAQTERLYLLGRRPG
jgi:SAM-dependent methyltransferase